MEPSLANRANSRTGKAETLYLKTKTRHELSFLFFLPNPGHHASEVSRTGWNHQNLVCREETESSPSEGSMASPGNSAPSGPMSPITLMRCRMQKQPTVSILNKLPSIEQHRRLADYGGSSHSWTSRTKCSWNHELHQVSHVQASVILQPLWVNDLKRPWKQTVQSVAFGLTAACL